MHLNKNIDNGGSGTSSNKGTGGSSNKPTGCSDDYAIREIEETIISDIFGESSLTAGHESNAMMKRAYPVTYDFIPSDDKYLNNEGECVVDQIDKIYGHLNNI